MTAPKKMACLLAVVATVALAGCATNPVVEHQERQQEAREATLSAMEKELAQVPQWFLKPIASDDTGAYAVATAKSSNMMHSINMAKMQAEFSIAKTINQVVSGRERSHTVDRNGNFQTTNEQTIIKQVSRADIVGYEVVNQEVQIQGDQYVTYMLIHLSFDAQQKMLNLRDNTFLKEAYRAYGEVEAADQRQQQAKEREQARELSVIQARADDAKARAMEAQAAAEKAKASAEKARYEAQKVQKPSSPSVNLSQQGLML